MTGLLAVLFMGFSIANGVSLWTGAIRTFVAICCLQAGYLLGLCISHSPAALFRIQRKIEPR